MLMKELCEICKCVESAVMNHKLFSIESANAQFIIYSVPASTHSHTCD